MKMGYVAGVDARLARVLTRESYLQITTESVAGRDLADSRPPIPQNILKMSRSPVSKRYSFSSSSCGNVHTSNASAFLQAEFIKHLPKTSPILMLNSHLCEEHLILWKYSRENSVASSDQKLTTLLFVLLFPTRSWFSSFLFIHFVFYQSCIFDTISWKISRQTFMNEENHDLGWLWALM